MNTTGIYLAIYVDSESKKSANWRSACSACHRKYRKVSVRPPSPRPPSDPLSLILEYFDVCTYFGWMTLKASVQGQSTKTQINSDNLSQSVLVRTVSLQFTCSTFHLYVCISYTHIDGLLLWICIKVFVYCFLQCR